MIKVCPECNATWLDGQLYWSTGDMGCPHDLAGLVCNDLDGKIVSIHAKDPLVEHHGKTG